MSKIEDFADPPEMESEDDETAEPEGNGQQNIEVCPKCGQPLVLCRGPVGPFIGCSSYQSADFNEVSLDKATGSRRGKANHEYQ